MNYTYRVVRHQGRWMIECTDDAGDVSFMTCGVAPTEVEVKEKLRDLLLDDDRVDVGNGNPRKFQS